jgi:hypothetical protein
VHVGNDSDLDRDYDSLATYAADHALAVEGPIREYDVVGPNETPDESLSRTEIRWPIFHIGGTPGRNLRRRSPGVDGTVSRSPLYAGYLVPLGESLRLGRMAASADVAPCRFDASTEPL